MCSVTVAVVVFEIQTRHVLFGLQKQGRPLTAYTFEHTSSVERERERRVEKWRLRGRAQGSRDDGKYDG